MNAHPRTHLIAAALVAGSLAAAGAAAPAALAAPGSACPPGAASAATHSLAATPRSPRSPQSTPSAIVGDSDTPFSMGDGVFTPSSQPGVELAPEVYVFPQGDGTNYFYVDIAVESNATGQVIGNYFGGGGNTGYSVYGVAYRGSTSGTGVPWHVDLGSGSSPNAGSFTVTSGPYSGSTEISLLDPAMNIGEYAFGMIGANSDPTFQTQILPSVEIDNGPTRGSYEATVSYSIFGPQGQPGGTFQTPTPILLAPGQDVFHGLALPSPVPPHGTTDGIGFTGEMYSDATPCSPAEVKLANQTYLTPSMPPVQLQDAFGDLAQANLKPAPSSR